MPSGRRNYYARQAAIKKRELLDTAIIHDHTDLDMWVKCPECGRDQYHTALTAHRYKAHGILP